MNKIYKLIWSQTANAFVAVSELATARDKSSSTTNNAVSSADKKAGIFKPVKTALVLSMLFVLPHSVMAGTGLVGGTATGLDAIAIGERSDASGVLSTALGADSVAQQKYANALGQGAQALGDDSAAVGTRAKALADYSTALGNQATAKKEYDLAAGYEAIASGGQSTAVGFRSKSTGTASNAIGGSSLAEGEYSTAVGQETHAKANFTLAAGYKAKALGEQSTAVGFGSQSTGFGSSAIGSSSLAKGRHSTAIGSSSLAEGDYSIALGQESRTGAGKNFTTALGYKSNASGWSSFAQGAYAEASGGGSIAIGDSSKATTNDTIAIGVKSEANLDNSVALGIRSKTSTNAVTVTSATVGNITYGGFTGAVSSVGSQISVGDTGNERQIKHVAAGTISQTSTDAINGSQLFSTQKALGNLASSTSSALGGGSNVQPDGRLSLPTYVITNNPKTPGTKVTVHTVGDALSALDSAVNVPLVFKGNTGNDISKKLGDTLSIKGDLANADAATATNLRVDEENGELKIKLARNLTDLDSVTVGNTVLNPNGLTVGGPTGPSITTNGINAGGKAITNVAPGVNDTDAVNVNQLKAAKSTVEGDKGVSVTPKTNADGSTTYTVAAKTDGTTTKIDNNGNIAAVTTTFTRSTDGEVGAPVGNGDSLVTANTVAEAINNSGWKATSGATGSGVVDGTTEELINPSETVTFQAGDNMVLNQAENVFTYSLNKDININSVQFNNGPKITNDGNNIKIGDKDGNATKITNVKAGEADTDAVNVSQLKEAADNLVTTGFNIADGKGGNDNVKLGETVTFADPAGNIITTVTDNKVEFGLNSTLSVGKDGEPGKVGIKGADGKDAISLNGKDGTIGINGKDGTNATLTVEKGKPGLDGKDGQTRIVYTKPDGSKEEVATLNDGLNFKADDGSIVPKKLNETLEIVGGADKDKLTDNNIGVNNKDGKLTVQLAKDLKGIDSITVNNGPVISGNGIDMNGDKITNLAPGVDATDAVNVSQLEKAQAAATTKVEGDKGVSVTPTTNADGSKTYTVAAKTDNTTVKVDDNGNIAAVTTTFTPSTDGKVGAPVGNGDSLVTANTVADAINKSGWKLAADGTTGTELIKPSDTVTFKTGSSNLTVKRDGANITYDLARNINVDSVQIGANGPKITNDGNNIKVGDKDGNATKITNVAAGTDDTDAVNVSQLKAVEATANKGWNLTTNGKADSKSNVKPGDTVDFANTDGNVKIENTGNKVTVNLNKDIDLTKDGSVTIGDTKVNNDGLTIVGGPSVTKSGINAGDKKITNVAPGEISADSKDAINGSQLYTVQQAAVAAKTEVKAGDNVVVKKESGGNGQDIYTVSAKDTSASVTAGSDAITVNKADPKKVGTVDVTDYKVDLSQATKDNIQKGVDAKDIVDNKGLTFAGDNNSSTEVQKLGSTVNVNGDSNITTQASGNTVKVTLNPNVTVESLTATNSVNVGSGGAQVALTTNVGKDGVRELSVGSANAPTRITNVAPGVNGTDAVNVDQLKGVGQHINNRITTVGNIANAGVAQAIATAGLPQAYLPGKNMMAIAGGTYEGEAGYAIGFSTISDNGKWIIKATGSGNSRGKFGASIGAGYQW